MKDVSGSAQLPVTARKTHLQSVIDDMNKNDGNSDNTAAVAGQPGLIIDALRAMRRFRDQIATDLKTLDAAKKTEGADAAARVQKVVNDLMKDLADARRATANTFESQALVLSEATKEPPVLAASPPVPALPTGQ